MPCYARCSSTRSDPVDERTLGGVHVDKAYAGFRKLQTFVDYGLKLPERLKIEVVHAPNDRRVGGYAWPHKIQLVGHDESLARKVRTMLLHEMVHAGLDRSGRNDEVHGHLFRQILKEAAEEAFGIKVRMPQPGERKDQKTLAYVLDDRIIAALKRKGT